MAAAARVVSALHADETPPTGHTEPAHAATDHTATGHAPPAGGAPGGTGRGTNDPPRPDRAGPDLPLSDLPRIAGYTLHRLLGRGGGGAVYLATRDGLDRRLALKLLNLRLGEGPAAQRAWRELDVLSQLHLAATPRVIDYGLHDGRLFIAAEYVEGLPLDKHCAVPSSPILPRLCGGDRLERGGEAGGGVIAGPSPAMTEGAPSSTSATPPQCPLASDAASPSHPLTVSPSQPLDLRARVELLARVADAVHALHEHGVIHRDIKPSNVIIDTHGDPVIIDLGLAALIADDVQASLTAEGVPIGSPAFMAPEQARGERSLISTRSDVYGLGASAYLVLTGHTPHDLSTPSSPIGGGGIVRPGRTMTEGAPSPTSTTPPRNAENPASSSAETSRDPLTDLEHRLFSSRAPDPVSLSRCVADSLPLHAAIHRVATQPPRDPRSLAPALPRPLAAVLLKAVAPRPQDRYPSAAALAADLRRWLRAEPVTAQPPTPWTRATRWIARHPIAATAAACAAIVVSMVGSTAAVIWWLNQQPAYFRWDPDRSSATLHSRSGNALKTWSGSIAGSVPLAEIVDAPASIGGGQLAVVCYPPDDAVQWGGRQVAVYRLSDLDEPMWMTPGSEPIKLPPPIVRSDDTWLGSPGLMCDVFDESLGDELVVIHANQYSQRAIRVYRLDGKVLFEAWHDGAVDSVAWFPDDRQLVFAGDNHEHNTPEWGHVDMTGGSPLVVLAIRPDLGGWHGWIHGPAATEDDRSIVAWYRYLAPTTAWAEVTIELPAPYGHPGPDNTPRVTLKRRADQSTVTFNLTPDGFLAEKHIVTDAYRRSEGAIDPALFRLVDFPPRGW